MIKFGEGDGNCDIVFGLLAETCATVGEASSVKVGTETPPARATADYAEANGDNDDFLIFPGRLNGIPIKAVIDSGGGCNLVSLEWVRSKGIKPDTSRFEVLLMDGASESKECPIIDAKWSFDGRKEEWDNVEFVVVEGYEHDALIGLPFLKRANIIHSSLGHLVF
jgi:hypothetical protein